MNITNKDVEHIAKLAKLSFDSEGIQKMQSEMNNILDYIHKLDELDTSKIEPLYHVISVNNVMREDIVKESFNPDESLKNAPAKTEKFFRVPKVIG